MNFDMQNFTVAAPLLALAAGALVILALDLLMDAKKAQPLWHLFGLGSVGIAGYYLFSIWNDGLQGFGGALIMDSIGSVFTLIILGITALTLLLSFSRGEEDQSGYLALVLHAAAGMIVLAAAGNLTTIFVGLELLSLSLYVKVAFDPKRAVAREAAFKYLILGSVASAFLLFGFGLIYGGTGTMDLAKLQLMITSGAGVNAFFYAGLALSFVGFAFKMALAPFHVWAPDVYQGAPTTVTAFMSAGTKTAAFAVLARFVLAVVPAAKSEELLLPLAVLATISMVLGATVGIWQSDLKRLMAYSGIANAGYLVLALPALSGAGVAAGAYYLAAYSFTVMGIFAVIQLLEHEGEEGANLAAFRGLYYRRPALAAAMSILMFALAGLPPSGGFIGKFLLAKSAVGASAWLMIAGLVVATGISAYVYLKVIFQMFRQEEGVKAGKAVMAGGQDEPLAMAPGTVQTALIAVILIAVAGTLLLGLLPGYAMSLLSI